MATTETPADLARLRQRVRDVIEEWRAAGRFEPICDAWLRSYDMEFSRTMARHGWLGMTWPVEHGGQARANTARLVVTEELLRAGAPVAAHWIADRQIGPAILRYGSEEIQRTYLPRIATAEVTFCLGMSETESGSDLASVRTTATPEGDGWRLTGRKIWTSQAHRSTHAYVLARTSRGERKQDGLTEFIVDMAAPGVDVRPILDLAGEHHFNEVTFDDVLIPGDHVLGQVGEGWTQVTEQLSFERGGMERVLSTYPLLASTLDALQDSEVSDEAAVKVGEACARLTTLRAMAWQVAAAMDQGKAPIQQAAMLKDLGTMFEGDVIELGRWLYDEEVDPTAAGLPGLLGQGVLAAPGFTIRGGTTEVLRTIISRSATADGLRAPAADGDGLRQVVDDVLTDRGGDPGQAVPSSWSTVRDLGWPSVGIDESQGGAGGTFAHLITLVQGLGRHACSMPLAVTALARQALAGSDRDEHEGISTIVLPGRNDELRLTHGAGGRALAGRVTRAPWARHAHQLVVCATADDGSEVTVVLRPGDVGVTIRPGSNLAGEPRDIVEFDEVPIADRDMLQTAPPHATIQARGALLTSAATLGALEYVYESTRHHVADREQFGRPIQSFQAVAHALATISSQLSLARSSVDLATDSHLKDHDDVTHVAVARVVTGMAATSVAATAHQLHGAMGITREHALHLGTRRLWSWRDEWGTQRQWALAMGRQACMWGSDGTWRWLTEHASSTNGEARP